MLSNYKNIKLSKNPPSNWNCTKNKRTKTYIYVLLDYFIVPNIFQTRCHANPEIQFVISRSFLWTNKCVFLSRAEVQIYKNMGGY